MMVAPVEFTAKRQPGAHCRGVTLFYNTSSAVFGYSGPQELHGSGARNFNQADL